MENNLKLVSYHLALDLPGYPEIMFKDDSTYLTGGTKSSASLPYEKRQIPSICLCLTITAVISQKREVGGR